MPAPPRARSWTTLWYYAVVLLSFGMLSGIPFAHAATRLRGRPAARWCAVFAVLYTAAMVTAFALTPTPAQPSDRLGATIAFSVIAVVLVHLTFVRRLVARVPRETGPADVDPAVAAVLRNRRAREEARRIVRTDPSMARELRIGRPDLPRTFDDGGLADLNSAPAAVIAEACGVDPAVAERLAAARATAGAPFERVDDAFAFADVPVELWDRIREHAVVVP